MKQLQAFIKQKTDVNLIIEILNFNGFEGYVVGGAIRDYLLNLPINDFDIATNVSIDELKSIFKDYQLIDINSKHSTLVIRINKVNYEVSSFKGKNIEEDLLKRDFTINSFAYNKKLICLNSSLEDLDNKIIRMNLSSTFNDDPLRILRAIRLALSLNFKIEENTSLYIKKEYPLLKNVSIERINAELKKILVYDRCEKYLKEYFDVFSFLMPELKNIDIDKTLDIFKKVDSLFLKLATLFYYLENNYLVSEIILKRLKFDLDTIKNVSLLLKYADYNLEDVINQKRMLNVFNQELIFELIKLQKAINQSQDYQKIEESIKNIIQKNSCFNLQTLSINGDDLIKLNYQGKMIGIILNEVLNQVIEGKLENDKTTILSWVKDNY